MIGIYKITNTVNNKIYIGQSINIRRRKTDHFKLLRSGKHCNPYLQHSFNKYGEDCFVFELVQECKEEDLNILEKYNIDWHNSLVIGNGYNLVDIIGGTYRHAKESIDLMKILQKGNSKRVFGFTKEGVFVKDWNSIKECAKELNCYPCDIRRTLNQKQYSCKGFILQKNNIFDNRLSLSEKVKSRNRNLNGTFSV